MTNDLYLRFIRPKADQKELLIVGQLTSVLLLLLGISTALVSNSIGSVFRLVIAIGTGPGVVLVLRWFWWRINAACELTAMLTGFLIGLVTSLVPWLRIEDYGIRLMVTTLITSVAWLSVLAFTPPESDEVLSGFVRKLRPPGPGWRSLRLALKVKPVENLSDLIWRFCLISGILFSSFLGIGSFLLHQERGGWIGICLTVMCIFVIVKKRLWKESVAI